MSCLIEGTVISGGTGGSSLVTPGPRGFGARERRAGRERDGRVDVVHQGVDRGRGVVVNRGRGDV